MKSVPFLLIVASLTWQSLSVAKTVTKRQSCSTGECGGPIPAPIPSPCFGGSCGSSCSGLGCLYSPPYQSLPSYQPPPSYQLPPYRPPPIPAPSPCSGGSCGTSCSGGGCTPPIPAPSPCSGGSCGTSCSGGGCTAPQPSPVRTCSSCINGCSSRCSSNQCVSNCLGSCSCDNERIIETPTNRCCDVLHPRNCFTDDAGSSRCVVRRHRECSDLCSSSVVSLQQREGSPSGCQYIRNYPYIYCGNYEKQNCGQCYNCDGRYNPTGCSRRPECTQGCRDVLPTNGVGLNA